LTGLQKLLQRLLEENQKQLGKYNLDTMMAEMKNKVADIIKQEQAAILKKLDEARKESRTK